MLHLKMRPAIVFLSIDVNQNRVATFLIIEAIRIEKLKSFPNESDFEGDTAGACFLLNVNFHLLL